MVRRHSDAVNGTGRRLTPRRPPAYDLEDLVEADGGDAADLPPVAGPPPVRRGTRPRRPPAEPAMPDGRAPRLVEDLGLHGLGSPRGGPAPSRATRPAFGGRHGPDDEGGGRDGQADDEFVGGPYQARPDNRLPGVFVPEWALEATPNGQERLVLGQLAYWFGASSSTGQPRARVKRDGYYWVATTYRKLGQQVGLDGRQVRYALDKLWEAGLVVTEVHGFGGRLMIHVRLRAAAIDERCRRATPDVGEDDDLL